MMQGSGNDNKKRRVVVLNSALNGCSEDYDGVINYQTETKKWTLQELVNLIESQGYTESDVSKFYQQRRHEKWMKLVSSDWFSVFLRYLDIKELERLDSAFCNHVDRPKWLNFLKTSKPSICIDCNRLTIKVVNWLIRKNMHPEELSLRCGSGFVALSDNCVFRLTENSPQLKKLEFRGGWTTINKMLFPYVAAYCTQLETLKLWNVSVPGNGLETLSKTCHQLKLIELQHLENHSGIDQLIKVNVNLLSLDLSLDSYIHSSILEILGLHCPLLQICRIEEISKHVNDIQIETFTKGCPNLKQLSINMSSTKMYHKLLHSLGSYNSALETLYLWRDRVGENDDEANDGNSELKSEQSQSLQCLSNRCPLLKKIDLSNFKLSTSNVSYLVNYSIHLEELILNKCNVCDDGLIIAKDANKLKYLKRLDLSRNPNITDESIINLVKGCRNLKDINIKGCPKLTDASICNIADNCPNLGEMFLTFDNINLTVIGLVQLLKNCPQLTKIISEKDNIPKEIQNQLKRRRNLTINIDDDNEDEVYNSYDINDEVVLANNNNNNDDDDDDDDSDDSDDD